MNQIRFTNCQGDNGRPMVAAIAAYLNEQMSVAVTFDDDMHWSERYAALDAGIYHAAWV